MRPSPTGFLAVFSTLLFFLLLASTLACRYPIPESMVFQGRKAPEVSDKVVRQNVSIPLTEGGALRGACFRVPDAKALLIHFYGNAEGLNRMSTRAVLLAQRFQLDVLCVDFRGYGASDGIPTLANLRADALRIYDCAEGLRAGRPVIVYGFSLGTLCASHVAANRSISGIVLAAPIATFDELLPVQQKLLPWYLKLALPFVKPAPDPAYAAVPQPLDDIARNLAPLLVLHGDADRIIPLGCGRRMLEASPAKSKRMVTFPSLDHNDLDLAFSAGPGREAFETLLGQALSVHGSTGR